MKIIIKTFLLCLGILLPLFLNNACKYSYNRKLPQNKEFVLLNEIITHENTDKPNKKMGFSVFNIPKSIPTNWCQPVNYKNGTMYYRVAVLSKPDTNTIHYQVGFQWEGGCDDYLYKEKFPDFRLLKISGKGIYNASQPIKQFWEPTCQTTDSIDWTKPITRILAVIRNKDHKYLDNRWGYGTDVDNIDIYYPMKVHLQVIIVPYGEDFRGWHNYKIAQPDK